MAVALKNPPVAPPSSPFDRVPVVSLVGTAYVVVSLGIVLEALPYLWRFTGLTGIAGAALLALVMVAVLTGLAVLGVRLFGPNRPAGARAGVFLGTVAFLIALLLTWWAGLWLEHWIYDYRWLGDSPSAGLAVAGVVGLVLLALLVYGFFRPEAEWFLVRLEGQGWFSATPYKGQQGQRVRRATILGLLLIGGSGVYTMMNNGLLRRMPENLYLGIPFTGAVAVESVGDAGPLIQKLDPKNKSQVQIVVPGASGFTEKALVSAQDFRTALKARIQADPDLDAPAKERLAKEVDDKDISDILELPGASDALVAAAGPAARVTMPPPDLPKAILWLNQYTVRAVNSDLRRDYVLVAAPKDPEKLKTWQNLTSLKLGSVVPKAEFDEAVKGRSDDEKPVAAPPYAATGPTVQERLTLLPALQYTLPLLLIAATLWLAWRIVNYPAFADFLIATEAELNKVSWTTRPRLIQDTIVVLVTTFLLALFLFLMDQTWRVVLSSKPVGVLQLPPPGQNQSVEDKPW